MSFVVRAATADDRDPVLDLLEALFAPPGIRPHDYTRGRGIEGFGYAVTHPDADIFIAVDDRVLVGLCSVYADFPSMRFGPRCWVEDLIVDPARRSLGIGRLLLDAATDWARARGCSHLELDSGDARVDAHRFYRAYGLADGSTVFGKVL